MNNKSYYMLLIVFVVAILLVGTVSASFLDTKAKHKDKSDYQMGNKLVKYNKLWERYKPIEIKGALGLGNTKAKIALVEHTEFCGQDCFSTIEIYLPKGGVLIEDIIFETLQEDGSWVEQPIRNYNFKIVDGNEKINYYIGQEVESGTYTLELSGQKKPSRTVDWKITTQGKLISELAIWTEVGTETHSGGSSNGESSSASITLTSLVENGYIKAVGLRRNSGGIDSNYLVNITQGGGELVSGILRLDGGGAVVYINFTLDDYGFDVIDSGTFNIILSRTSGNQFFSRESGASFSGSLFSFSSQLVPAHAGAVFTFGNLTGGIGSILNSPTDDSSFNISNIQFNATGSVGGSGSVENMSLYTNETGDWELRNSTLGLSGSSSTQTWNRTLPDGNFVWNVQTCDSDGDCDFATNNFSLSVDTTFPVIDITAPPSIVDSHSIGNPLFLNWTVSDLSLDKCWYDYNSINTTVTCNDNTTSFNTVEGEQSITLYANDSVGNENSANTSWSYAFLETGVAFNGNVSETSRQSFEINVTTDITVQSISAILNYNGTNHTSTASCTSGNCTIINTIDIDLVTVGESELHDFFWDLTIFNGTDSISIITTTKEQNVSRIHLEECDATFTTQALNFTTYDEQNLTRLSNFRFDGTFEQWTGSGTIRREKSFTNESVSELNLCILPTDETFFIDAIMEYDEADNESIYTLRNYFFQNDTISNSSQDIFLYLLKSSASTSFILKVQDDSLLPVSDVLVEINRFYPGTNEFRVVQIAKTDDSGKSVGFFETEIVDYKFFITLDNETLLETGIQKVIPETSPFTLTFNIGEPLGEPWASQEPIEDLNSTLVWNDTSGFVTYVYIDTSTLFSLARLLVTKQDLANATNDSVVCNETSTLTSATLICNVGTTNGFYIASAFITRDSSEDLDKQITFQVETLSGVVGFLGLFYGWFLILIASFMFKFNEIAGIWAITITVFLVNIIGLIKFGGVFVTATIAVALILTWIMER